MDPQSRTAEEIIAELATAAHGIVTRAELVAADPSRTQIRNRVRKGLLIPEYPGVYRAGHRARSRESDYMAAIKAADGVLYNQAAGHLLAILKSPGWPQPEVMTASARDPKGLKPRHVRRIDPRDVTEVSGLPVTTVPVTLVHLAATLDDEELAKAVHLAHVIYRVGPRHVETVLARHPNSKGAARLRAIIAGDTKTLLSYLEKGFIAILIAEGLPLPETNRYTDGHYVDCRFADHRLTVELLGFRFHNSRCSFDEMNDREREAYARGDQFRRYTYKDVYEDPTRMLAELRDLLA